MKLLLIAALALALPAQTVKTDYAVYPIPPSPPSLPAAGAKATDPTFGTEILRITDEKDGQECSVNYSYWPSFSKDSKWLMAGCQKKVSTWTEPITMFYSWDAEKFTATKKRAKPLGPDLSQGIWSGTNPDLLWAPGWNKLHSYNAATDVVALVKDFTVLFPGEYQWQWHRSLDDDLFSFTRRRESDYATVGYAVWRRSTDTIVYQASTPDVDEVQIDKAGKFLVVKTGRSGATVVEGKYVNLATGAVRNLLDGAPDFDLGHSDNGSGIQVGEEDWNGRVWKYSLSDPSVKVDLFGSASFPGGYPGGHYSMLADDESWVLAGTIYGTGPLGSEFYLLATDGSAKIRRLLHHRSVYRVYSDAPRPNISRDGKWIAFTSNWGDLLRRDVYVAKVPQDTPPVVLPDLLGEYSVVVIKNSTGEYVITVKKR